MGPRSLSFLCHQNIAVILFFVLWTAAEGDLPPPGDAHATGDLWLIGGRPNTQGTGTVLINREGTWGFICDDGWNFDAADIVCKTLGYERALTETVEDEFDYAKYSELPILLDDVQCFGDETSILHCRHTPLGVHDCHRREAAGVFCAPDPNGNPVSTRPTAAAQVGGAAAAAAAAAVTQTTVARAGTTALRTRLAGSRSTTPTPPTTPPTTTTNTTTSLTSRQASSQQTLKDKPPTPRTFNDLFKDDQTAGSRRTMADIVPDVPQGIQLPARFRTKPYKVRVVNGRNPEEGRLEVKLRYGVWGVICSDTWGLLETTVACKQAGKGFGRVAIRVSFFGGQDMPKVAAGIKCTGEEASLSQCAHEQFGDNVRCPRGDLVAGVICADVLPDLVPNATLLEQSSYLEDKQMVYLQCAMEENCAASSAYRVLATDRDWQYHRRRLLRFSSSTWNFGTADFRPQRRKEEWEWHLCHMHYHSMDVFAHYDLLDVNGTRVAEGHKASFCLEDVQCKPGVEKQYICKGYGDQGITVGCADDYLHDIDCQWIDITDVTPGHYTFRVHINPEYKVAELDYTNNAVHCDLWYTGVSVHVTHCETGRPTLGRTS